MYTHECEYCGNQARVMPKRLAPGTKVEVVEQPVPRCACTTDAYGFHPEMRRTGTGLGMPDREA